MSVKAKPDGYHSITPYLLSSDADRLITFLKEAFSAKVTESIAGPDDRTVYAELKIGDSIIMIGGKKDTPQSSVMLYLYVDNTDATYKQALAAGATSMMAPCDQFYGDRNAAVKDFQGIQWCIATHIEDLSSEEIQKRAKTFHRQQNNQ